MITVVVPAYNAQDTLAETLNALQAQNDPTWQCIVVDDGSVDRTLEIAQDFAQKDSRFTVISKQNGGTASAYNAGVAQVDTPYVAICSADDILDKEWNSAFKSMISEHPEYSIYCSNGWYLFHDSKQVKDVYSSSHWGQERELSLREVVRRCFFSVGTVYRREMFDELGGYRIGVYGEDYDLWLRAMVNGAKVFYSPRRLAFHRISSFQKTNDAQKVMLSAYEVIDYSLRRPHILPEVKKEIVQGLRLRKIDSIIEKLINRIRRIL